MGLTEQLFVACLLQGNLDSSCAPQPRECHVQIDDRATPRVPCLVGSNHAAFLLAVHLAASCPSGRGI